MPQVLTRTSYGSLVHVVGSHSPWLLVDPYFLDGTHKVEWVHLFLLYWQS